MIYHNIAKKRSLSDSAFDILYALYSEDGQRLSQLCKTSFLSKQTLSSSVKRLEEEGLLRTERQNSRFVQVYLTEAGWECAPAALSSRYSKRKCEQLQAFPKKNKLLFPTSSSIILRRSAKNSMRSTTTRTAHRTSTQRYRPKPEKTTEQPHVDHLTNKDQDALWQDSSKTILR